MPSYQLSTGHDDGKNPGDRAWITLWTDGEGQLSIILERGPDGSPGKIIIRAPETQSGDNLLLALPPDREGVRVIDSAVEIELRPFQTGPRMLSPEQAAAARSAIMAQAEQVLGRPVAGDPQAELFADMMAKTAGQTPQESLDAALGELDAWEQREGLVTLRDRPLTPEQQALVDGWQRELEQLPAKLIDPPRLPMTPARPDPDVPQMVEYGSDPTFWRHVTADQWNHLERHQQDIDGTLEENPGPPVWARVWVPDEHGLPTRLIHDALDHLDVVWRLDARGRAPARWDELTFEDAPVTWFTDGICEGGSLMLEGKSGKRPDYMLDVWAPWGQGDLYESWQDQQIRAHSAMNAELGAVFGAIDDWAKREGMDIQIGEGPNAMHISGKPQQPPAPIVDLEATRRMREAIAEDQAPRPRPERERKPLDRVSFDEDKGSD